MALNRRRFFQSLSAAILGTALALKLPESFVPQLKVSNDKNYSFGFTGYDGDNNLIKGRILAQVQLETLMPRMSPIIHIENC
jgi:hypothetical protein